MRLVRADTEPAQTRLFFIGRAAENRFPLFLRALCDLSGGRGKGKSFFVPQRVEEKPELLFQAEHNRVCRTFVRQGDACLASRDRALVIGAKKGQAIMRRLEPSRWTLRSCITHASAWRTNALAA